MLSSSKMTRYMALASIIVSTSVRAEFPVNNPAAVCGATFALIGGKWVEKVPGVKTVNETVSKTTGIDKHDLLIMELAAGTLAAAQYSGKIESKTTLKCLRAGTEGLVAHQLVGYLHSVEALDAWLPEKGTWGDKLLWFLTASALHTGVNKATQQQP